MNAHFPIPDGTNGADKARVETSLAAAEENIDLRTSYLLSTRDASVHNLLARTVLIELLKLTGEADEIARAAQEAESQPHG